METLDPTELHHLKKIEALQSKIQEQAKMDLKTIAQMRPSKETGWCFKEKWFYYEPKHDFCSLKIYKDAIQTFGSDSFSWRSTVKQEHKKCWIETRKTTSCVNF